MFEQSLTGSTSTARSARLGPVSAALVLHAGVLSGLAALSVLALNPVPSGPSTPVMVFVPAPPPLDFQIEPPPGPREAQPGTALAGAPPAPRPIVQPERVPDMVADVVPVEPPAISDLPPGADEGLGARTGVLGEGAGSGNGSAGGGDGVADGLGGGTGFGPVPLGPTVIAPRLIVKVQPDYPAFARKARLEGQVVLRAVVSPDGIVTNVEVVRSTNPVFDRAAIDAVRQWRYTPPTQSGRPVSVWFEVVVTFTLR